jgi:hypothetical protein
MLFWAENRAWLLGTSLVTTYVVSNTQKFIGDREEEKGMERRRGWREERDGEKESWLSKKQGSFLRHEQKYRILFIFPIRERNKRKGGVANTFSCRSMNSEYLLIIVCTFNPAIFTSAT